MLFLVFNANEYINVIRQQLKPGTKYKNVIRNNNNRMVEKKVSIFRMCYK